MPRVPKIPRVNATTNPEIGSKPAAGRGPPVPAPPTPPWDPPPPPGPVNGRNAVTSKGHRVPPAPGEVSALDTLRERRQYVVTMLLDGVEEETMRRTLRKRFGCERNEARGLVKKVLNEWAAADADRRPHEKRLQVRRLVQHIRDAKRDKSHSAVASFERLLAQILGTLEPTEVHVNVDARVRESVHVVLSQLSPERVVALADRAREMRADRPPPVLVEAPPTEVAG